VVQVDLVEAQVGELVQPGGVAAEIGGHQHRAAHVLRANVPRRLVELLDGL
jgi:hypothetical protein